MPTRSLSHHYMHSPCSTVSCFISNAAPGVLSQPYRPQYCKRQAAFKRPTMSVRIKTFLINFIQVECCKGGPFLINFIQVECCKGEPSWEHYCKFIRDNYLFNESPYKQIIPERDRKPKLGDLR